jgi:hypothetical protein
VAWLADISREFAERCPDGVKAESKLVSACAWGLATNFSVLKNGGRFLSQVEADLLGRAGKTVLLASSGLSKIYGGD